MENSGNYPEEVVQVSDYLFEAVGRLPQAQRKIQYSEAADGSCGFDQPRIIRDAG